MASAFTNVMIDGKCFHHCNLLTMKNAFTSVTGDGQCFHHCNWATMGSADQCKHRLKTDMASVTVTC